MSFQGFLPSLPTFSPLRIPVLTTCFSESNFNTDLTLKERAKVGPRMQTSVSQKSPQSSNPKWSYQIRQSYMTMSGDFGGFILSMQDFIIFFFVHTNTVVTLQRLYFPDFPDFLEETKNVQMVRTSNGLKAGFSSLITQIKVKSGFK